MTVSALKTLIFSSQTQNTALNVYIQYTQRTRHDVIRGHGLSISEAEVEPRS